MISLGAEQLSYARSQSAAAGDSKAATADELAAVAEVYVYVMYRQELSGRDSCETLSRARIWPSVNMSLASNTRL